MNVWRRILRNLHGNFLRAITCAFNRASWQLLDTALGVVFGTVIDKPKMRYLHANFIGVVYQVVVKLNWSQLMHEIRIFLISVACD